MITASLEYDQLPSGSRVDFHVKPAHGPKDSFSAPHGLRTDPVSSGQLSGARRSTPAIERTPDCYP